MADKGSDGGGGAGAAWQFYLRHHVVLLSIVLSLMGIATGVATAFSLLQGASWRGAAAILAGAILAAGVAWFHTRHFGLTVLAAITPLPGLLWAAPMSAGSAFGAIPALAYVLAFAMAVMLTQDILLRNLDDSAADPPYRSAAAAAGLMAALGLLWFLRGSLANATFQAVADIVLSGGTALLLVPIGETFLHFDEASVSQSNRAREYRLRVLEKIAMVAVPRWGMSIAGIAMILLALAWFGAVPAFSFFHFGSAVALAGASAGLVFLIATAASGGWREGLAATIVTALTCLTALWGFAAIGKAPIHAPVGIAELVSLTLFLILCQVRRAHAYVVRGEDPSVARLRAVEEFGGPQAFAILGGIVMLIPTIVTRPIFAPYAIALIFAGAGAIGFAPALVTATEVLLPRRRSVEDLYGRR